MRKEEITFTPLIEQEEIKQRFLNKAVNKQEDRQKVRARLAQQKTSQGLGLEETNKSK